MTKKIFALKFDPDLLGIRGWDLELPHGMPSNYLQCLFEGHFSPTIDLFLSVHLSHCDEEMMIEFRIKLSQGETT